MLEETVCLSTEASTWRCTEKPAHRDQYFLFESHHPLEHTLGVIRALNHRAETVPTNSEGKEKEQKHIRGVLKTCGYPNWTFVWTSKRSRADREEEKASFLIAAISEKLIFSKHHIPVDFKPTGTLRQKRVHPEENTPRHKQSDIVYAVQCIREQWRKVVQYLSQTHVVK